MAARNYAVASEIHCPDPAFLGLFVMLASLKILIYCAIQMMRFDLGRSDRPDCILGIDMARLDWRLWTAIFAAIKDMSSKLVFAQCPLTFLQHRAAINAFSTASIVGPVIHASSID